MKRALIFITLICLAGGFIFYKIHNRPYACETVIQLPTSDMPCSTVSSITGRSFAPRRGGSDKVINRAILDYQLETLFGLTSEELKEKISNNLEIPSVKATSLASIITYAKTEKQARQMNYAIVRSYQKVIKEENLLIKIRWQEDKTEDYKMRLDALSRKLGRPYGPYTLRDFAVERAESIKKKNNGFEYLTYSPVEKTRLGKAIQDYERELKILNAIKSALEKEHPTDKTLNKYKLTLPIHQKGWTPEIETMMEARQQKK